MSEAISSEPSLKRKRANENDDAKSDDSEEIEAVTRSTLWFDDGNIILQASSTQFRLHKGVLSRNSSVFKNMFAVPQPESEPTIEGCAIVHVADEAQDWENILKIIYDNVKVYTSSDAVSLPLLGSMLRLGRKYEFDHLQVEAMKRLNANLPRTLELWDKSHNKDGERKLSYDPYDLIDLLMDLGLKSMLPVAYYICLEDYTLETIVRTFDDIPSAAKKSLILGYDTISQLVIHSLEWLKIENIEGCLHAEKCNARRTELTRKVIKHWHSTMLFAPKAWKLLYSSPTPFCPVCIATMREKIQATRQKVWDDLPIYFDMPAWGDLKDD